MKIVTIVGARPQFVKAAALSREFSKHDYLNEIIVHTGQHFDTNMSEIFFNEMEIPTPKYNLNINSVGHGAMTGRMLEGIEAILLKEQPDLVLVYGDTNSTVAGALAAKKLHIKVAHVEAGLRSFNTKMPEEINRILTDRISDYLFCPTSTAVENLIKEGYEQFDCKIINCGDVMQDAAMFYAEKSAEKSTIIQLLNESRFILCTLHRAENTDNTERLSEIILALNHISKSTPIIIPIHPRTKEKLKQLEIAPQIKLIDPIGYFDMIELLKRCSLVITDSGGLQKEAFFFKKNCVTMREQTEWVELVKHGVNLLTGHHKEKIINAVKTMQSKNVDFSINLYGKGKACENIVNELLKNN